MNYGLFPDVQFSVSTPAAYALNDNESHFAMGDEEIGLKYRFVHEGPSRPQISFYPSVTLATGNERYDLGLGHGTLFLPVWAQKTNGKWTFFGGGGIVLDSSAPSGHTWQEGLAVTRDLSETTNVGLEVFHSGAQSDSPAVTDVGVGWIHELGEFHAMLFSAGASIGSAPSYRAYGAYEWRLGPQKNAAGE